MKISDKRILVFDRDSGSMIEENVCPRALLHLLYDRNAYPMSPIRTFVGRLPLISFLYGFWQKMPWTRFSINKFIKTHKIDSKEFVTNDFISFNDFFVRKLKSDTRPISDKDVVAPADGRYFCYQDVDHIEGIHVKGESISLLDLLGRNETLTERYLGGSMIIVRLAPCDYHRFHVPVDCFPSRPSIIQGSLYSVSPIALRRSIDYITQNKRKLCRLRTKEIGDVMAVAVGATNVGSIQFTVKQGKSCKRGDELGLFALGGSLLVFLFEPGKVQFSKDVLEQTENGIEVLCKMGQPLGEFQK